MSCFAGLDFTRATSLGNSTGCTLSCSGNSTQICGGPLANSLYRMTSVPVLSAIGTIPKTSQGCWAEGAPRRLPQLLLDDPNNMTQDLCAYMANLEGFPLFGVQFSRECFGGKCMSPPVDSMGATSGAIMQTSTKNESSFCSPN